MTSLTVKPILINRTYPYTYFCNIQGIRFQAIRVEERDIGLHMRKTRRVRCPSHPPGEMRVLCHGATGVQDLDILAGTFPPVIGYLRYGGAWNFAALKLLNHFFLTVAWR